MELETIVVRDFAGRAFVRWMVRTEGRTALLTNESGAQAARAGLEPMAVLGFPVTDVYRLPESRLFKDGDEPDWSGLTPRFL
jgi:hypothetical protein